MVFIEDLAGLNTYVYHVFLIICCYCVAQAIHASSDFIEQYLKPVINNSTSSVCILRNQQSPINLSSRSARRQQDAPIFTRISYEVFPSEQWLVNDGTTVLLHATWCVAPPCITGGPLGREEWYFTHAEFRWGPSENEGSEHMLDNQRFALELQLVHKSVENEPYPLCAILAILFEEYDYDNPFLDPIVTNLCHIRNPCSRINIQPFPLEWLSPPLFYGFYSYMGSLTRCPYDERVLWLIKIDTLPISRAQVNAFRKIYGTNLMPLRANTRPVQRLKARSVCYFPS